MELRLTARARIKALGIVNNWPATNRGTLQMLDRVAQALELTDADREAVQWRQLEVAGEARYAFRADVVLISEIGPTDAGALRQMIEPSVQAVYTRAEAPVLAELETKLGALVDAATLQSMAGKDA